MANTSYLRYTVEPWVRDRLAEQYRQGFAPRVLRLAPGGSHEFDAVSDDGRIVGTLAVVEAQPDVGHLHWLRVDPQWQRPDFAVVRALRRAAAEHARDVGLLKLAMHVPSEREGLVASYCHQLGFELSRAREVEGVHVLEFYLNLYERPELGGAP